MIPKLTLKMGAETISEEPPVKMYDFFLLVFWKYFYVEDNMGNERFYAWELILLKKKEIRKHEKALTD